MVITQSLAKGALRDAIRKQSEARQQHIAQFEKIGYAAPSTRRRYGEWFRKHTALEEKVAVLIAHSMPDRRRGVFAKYFLDFFESNSDWKVVISMSCIEFRPGRIERVDSAILPVTISGHALERIFQRTDSIEWRVVRDYIAGAVLFANAVTSVWLKSGSQQCAVLAEKGLLVGQVVDDELRLRTFLPETDLGPRWEALFRDLKAFSAEHEQAINAAALGLRDDATVAFAQFLASGRHRWLFQPYIPGVDPEEDAWRAQH